MYSHLRCDKDPKNDAILQTKKYTKSSKQLLDTATINTHKDLLNALRLACNVGYVEKLNELCNNYKYEIQNIYNDIVFMNELLEWSSFHNHLNIVKYLIDVIDREHTIYTKESIEKLIPDIVFHEFTDQYDYLMKSMQLFDR